MKPEAEKIPEAVQWHEGMMLSPHHFQQTAIRNEMLLNYHLSHVAPFHWGIRRLQVDQTLLIDGTFRILDLEAVMPDGLLVLIDDESPYSFELDLTPYMEELSQKPIAVQLAVPVQRTGSAAVKGTLPRYDSIEGKPVADENTGGDEMSLPRLRPRLNLLVTDTPSAKYTAFPLARVVYKNEAYALADYIPPMLCTAPKTALWQMCSEISQRIREKAVFLSEKLTAPDSPIKGPKAIETKLLIQNLVSSLTPFETLLNSGVSHPFQVYLWLSSLVGNLSGLVLGAVPPVLKAYDHNDINRCFVQAKTFLFRMIDEGILESHTAILFELDNGVFSLKLKEEWIQRTLIIGVQTRPGATEREMLAWMEECLIGSEPTLESMKERRILGARRKRIDADDELVPTGGLILYSVESSEEFTRPDQHLIIYNSSDPGARRGPIEITLFVRNRS